ncbi:MAG: RNA polymerase sigma factor [Candidatus Acidiferrum sp.]
MLSTAFRNEKNETRLLESEPKKSAAPHPQQRPSTVVKEDEHLVVASAKNGNGLAFEELVNRYERKILRLTMNITRNREDAEDAMQDAFLKSYAHLNDFHGDSRFYTWLVRIAANEALMRLRKRRRDQVSLDPPIEGETDFVPREIQDWGPNPEQRFAQSEVRSILNAAIEDLDPAFRMVFLLRDVEEFSTAETARLLNLSIPAAKSRLLRARLKLRESLNLHFRKDIYSGSPKWQFSSQVLFPRQTINLQCHGQIPGRNSI